jgi:hypothetical protein
MAAGRHWIHDFQPAAAGIVLCRSSVAEKPPKRLCFGASSFPLSYERRAHGRLALIRNVYGYGIADMVILHMGMLGCARQPPRLWVVNPFSPSFKLMIFLLDTLFFLP